MSADLSEVYAHSKPFIADIVAHQQEVEDFIRALRFLMRAGQPDGGPFLSGFEMLLSYHESMRRVLLSYHTAVGALLATETVQEEEEVS